MSYLLIGSLTLPHLAILLYNANTLPSCLPSSDKILGKELFICSAGGVASLPQRLPHHLSLLPSLSHDLLHLSPHHFPHCLRTTELTILFRSPLPSPHMPQHSSSPHLNAMRIPKVRQHLPNNLITRPNLTVFPIGSAPLNLLKMLLPSPHPSPHMPRHSYITSSQCHAYPNFDNTAQTIYWMAKPNFLTASTPLNLLCYFPHHSLHHTCLTTPASPLCPCLLSAMRIQTSVTHPKQSITPPNLTQLRSDGT